VNINASDITLSAPLGTVASGATTVVPTPQTFTGLTGTQGTLFAAVDGSDVPGPVSLSGGIGLTNTEVVFGALGFGTPTFSVNNASATIGGSTLRLNNSFIDGGSSFNILRIVNGTLTSTSRAPVIEVVGRPTPVQPSLEAFRIVDIASSGTLSANGSVLKVTNATFNPSPPDVIASDVVIYLGGNATLTTTSSDPAVLLQNSFLVGFGLLETDSGGDSVTLGGSLLAASGSLLSFSEFVVRLENDPPVFNSASTAPVISLTNTSLDWGADAMFDVHCCGIQANLAGPILAGNDSRLSSLGPVVFVERGEIVTSTTLPLVSLTGPAFPPHSVSFGGTAAMFDLKGSTTAPPVVVEGVSLTLGTEQPIRGPGGACPPCPVPAPLLAVSGTTVNTNQFLKLDTALLEASAPLMTLASTLNSNSDLVKLTQNAKLTTATGFLPSDALIKLNASTLDVFGSLFNVAGGSFLNVTGKLVSLINGSTLNITNGAMVALSGGSVFRLTGSLGVFGGSGTNTINLPTGLSGYTVDTTKIPGFGVALKDGSGATASQVSVQNFGPFSPGGTVTANGIVLKIDDPNSRARLCTSACDVE
jgi:hypothetical protein